MYAQAFRQLTILLLLGSTGLGQESMCRAECNPENGFCDKKGECRCRPGWRGATCQQCVPFPGCVHGTCEKAWQCVCEKGWAGSHCDQDTHVCSSKPCSGNSNCFELGENGYICICPLGFTGENCQLKKAPCLMKDSLCQNGGTCVDNNGFDRDNFCLCPPGFIGHFCEIQVDKCEPNPCLNGGTCTNHGTAITCICPPAFSGPICNASLTSCSDSTCKEGGTCVNMTDGRTHCGCSPGLTGPSCDLHTYKRKPKNRSKPSLGRHSLHYTLPAHASHQVQKRPHPESKLLMITLKKTLHASSPLVTYNQVTCLALLTLLTCLVILGTMGIIFFNRCEAWLANVKYSQLVRRQRDYHLKDQDHPVNIILPEKVKLTIYGKHYTSM